MAQTATEWYIDKLKSLLSKREEGMNVLEFRNEFDQLSEQAKQLEEKNLKTAMIYALDEDGHTGDWKIRFVNDYFNQTFSSSKEKYDQDESGYPIH